MTETPSTPGSSPGSPDGSDPLGSPPVVAQAAMEAVIGPVPPDTTCIRCGYELTGLDAAGDCPECGTAIARSLSDDRLADADPAWLKRALLGLRLLAWGPIVVVITGVASIVLAIIVEINAITFPQLGLDLYGALSSIASVVIFAGLAAAALGGFLVTAIEPRDQGRERLDEPRVIARWGLVAAIALPATMSAVLGTTAIRIPESIRLLVVACAVASGGFALSSLHARFRQFAVRIPSPALATRCESGQRWYRRGTIFVASIMVLMAAEKAADAVPALAPLALALSVVTALGGCVSIFVAIIGFFRVLAVLDLSMALRSRIVQTLSPAANAAPIARPDSSTDQPPRD